MARDMLGAVAGQGFEEIAITVDDAQRAGQLPGPHRDPSTALLIAQAVVHGSGPRVHQRRVRRLRREPPVVPSLAPRSTAAPRHRSNGTSSQSTSHLTYVKVGV